MSLPTAERPVGALPVEHSIDDHLDAERAVLAEERRAAAASDPGPSRRVSLLRSVGLGLALAGTIAIGWNHVHQPAPKAKFCTADGFITKSGETLTKDADCRWVDSQGNPVPVDQDGRPAG